MKLFKRSLKDEGVSPIIGVIVLVVIAIILASTVGVSVFNIGQNTPQESGVSGVDIDENTEEGTVTVQMISKGTSDEILVQNGVETKRIISPGQVATINASDRVTVIGVTNGEKTVLKDYKPKPKTIAKGTGGPTLLSVSQTADWNEGTFSSTNANSPLKLNTENQLIKKWHSSVSYPEDMRVGESSIYYKDAGIFSVDKTDGVKNWEYRPFSTSTKGFTVLDDTVYTSEIYDYNYYQLSAINSSTGNTKWTKRASDYNISNTDEAFEFQKMTSGSDYVYASSNGGILYAFDMANKSIEWKKNLGITTRRLKYSDGNLYSVGNNDVVRKIDGDTGTILKEYNNLPEYSTNGGQKSSDEVSDGKYVYSSAYKTGVYDLGSESSIWYNGTIPDLHSTVSEDEGVLYTFQLDYYGYGSRLLAFNSSTGDHIFTKDINPDKTNIIREIEAQNGVFYTSFDNSLRKYDTAEQIVSSGSYQSKTYTFDSKVYWGQTIVEVNKTRDHTVNLTVNGKKTVNLEDGRNTVDLDGLESDSLEFKLELTSTNPDTTPQIVSVKHTGVKEGDE